MNKKYLLISGFLPVILSLLIFTACSSSMSSEGMSSDRNEAYPGANGGGIYDEGYDDSSSNEGGYEVTAPSYNSAGDNEPEMEKKIVKNAALDLESSDVEETYQKFLVKAESNGGYEFGMDMNKSDGYIHITATIKVPPESLDEVLGYASECGTVRHTKTTVTDITDDYYDIEIRLENKERNLEKYYEYLSQADGVSELVQLQNEIDRITAEIESYKGQLKLWNSQISESSISVSIYQKDDPNILKQEVDWGAMSLPEMGTSMLNGFKTVCNIIFGFIQWFVIAIVTISPVLVIAGGVTFTVIKLAGRRKK